MWNSSEFGGNFGSNQPAGGFLNSTVSSPATQEKKRPERLSNVVPCTIAQIMKMPENEEYLKVGSLSARIVTFVGLLHAVDVQSTKVTFMVNDMSGPSIEVQVWLGENEEMEKKVHNVRENTYVRVMGAVRSMKGRRHIIGFKVTPITEANEITMHILEVMHTSMSVSVMDKQPNDNTMDYTSSTVPLGSGTGSTVSGLGSVTSAFGGQGSYDAHKGLSKHQQIVFQAISAATGPQGASIFDLYESIKSMNRGQIKDAVEFLSNEGHIYSTIDEDHYRSTE